MRNLLIILLIGTSACAASKLTVPTQDNLSKAEQHYPGTTMAQLERGQIVYQAQCNACHPLKNPASRTVTEWQSIVPEMVAKSNKKAGKEVIGQADQESLVRYLVSASGS